MENKQRDDFVKEYLNEEVFKKIGIQFEFSILEYSVNPIFDNVEVNISISKIHPFLITEYDDYDRYTFIIPYYKTINFDDDIYIKELGINMSYRNLKQYIQSKYKIEFTI